MGGTDVIERPRRQRRTSAGILLYRRRRLGIEVLIGHPGGPYFAHRDADTWSIPKGEVEAGEEPIDVARREFAEETGHELACSDLVSLGSTVQKGGKLVHCWTCEGDLDPGAARSNTFRLEFPAGSGRYVDVPELDRVAWFRPNEARIRIKAAQAVFLDRLEELLAEPGPVSG